LSVEKILGRLNPTKDFLIINLLTPLSNSNIRHIIMPQ
jgi:hypothetical protein